jgi:LmbE family N-acetylglucosaminyl deacetylase
VREVYIISRENADLWVDITETIEAKIAALREHASQVGDRQDEVAKWVREGAQRTAEGHGMQYAEGYKYVRLRT